MFSNWIRQTKTPSWIGAFQIQVQNALFYQNMVSTCIGLLTFWYTAGYQIRDNHIPWFSLGLFVAALAIYFVIVMIVDYRFIQPARQSYLNKQSYKHENPGLVILLDIQKRVISNENRLARLEKKLGIENE